MVLGSWVGVPVPFFFFFFFSVFFSFSSSPPPSLCLLFPFFSSSSMSASVARVALRGFALCASIPFLPSPRFCINFKVTRNVCWNLVMSFKRHGIEIVEVATLFLTFGISVNGANAHLLGDIRIVMLSLWAIVDKLLYSLI